MPRCRASILALYRSAIEVGAEWKPGLSSMTAPALVIWGLDDPFLPHRFADEGAGNATRAHAVVKLRSSHWPMIERPADVARELEAHSGLTFNYLRLPYLGSNPRSRNANGNDWSPATRPSICPETKPW